MVGKKLRNIPIVDNVLDCKSKEEYVVSEGSGFLSCLTLETSLSCNLGSSPNVIVAIPSVTKAQPSTNTSIHILSSISITVLRVVCNKTRVGKGKGKPTYRTKSWRSQPISYEFKLKD